MANKTLWNPDTVDEKSTMAPAPGKADQGDPGAAQKALEAAEKLMEEVEGYANYFEQLTEEVGGSHQGSSDADAIEHMLHHLEVAHGRGGYVQNFDWADIDGNHPRGRQAVAEGHTKVCRVCGWLK